MILGYMQQSLEQSINVYNVVHNKAGISLEATNQIQTLDSSIWRGLSV